MGHSEIAAHIHLTFNDSGIVNSSTLPVGTPITLRFIVLSHSTGVISEPTAFPFPSGNYAELDMKGYLNLFDENWLTDRSGLVYLSAERTVHTLNSAVGHRIDLTAANFINGNGYAGYMGRKADG